MSKPIIEIEKISKRYQIGAHKEPYLSLRDEVAKYAKRLVTSGKEYYEKDFCALQDISFNVKEGEAIGIIGRNGAGKSTLLKILSQITPPTEGKITMRGRVASLLEVGTGFHPELTGRENIFLNGTILGMTRREVTRKFDEIVDFAEVEKFLDTPVKRYSSGMYVRLAFAVAAHLEPEILIIDEVLAVGDAQFQKKCLGKMSQVAKGGRTVLFVSHNMAAIEFLCHRSIVLKNGMLAHDNISKVAIQSYLGDHKSFQAKIKSDNFKIGVKDVWFENSEGKAVGSAKTADDIKVCISFKTGKVNPRVRFALVFRDNIEHAITSCDSELCQNNSVYSMSEGTALCIISRFPFAPGEYYVDVSMNCDGEPLDFIHRAAYIDIELGDYFGTGRAPDSRYGNLYIEHNWLVTTKLKEDI